MNTTNETQWIGNLEYQNGTQVSEDGFATAQEAYDWATERHVESRFLGKVGFIQQQILVRDEEGDIIEYIDQPLTRKEVEL